MPTIRVRYFAGARAAAGVDEEPVLVPDGGTVEDALAEIGSRRGEGLCTVLRACSFLLDGIAVHDRARPLADGALLDVLPPFAGG
ncbi:MAG: MoaD/ThiS family protein [Sciscionella sp.]|nr:MoaD/ThiS family protein [Sciscionella sp.]